MTKYLLNLVCIVGIAGAAHAQTQVANVEITKDGHAFLVFADGGDNMLTGYSIQDIAATPTLTLLAPSGAEDARLGQATAWMSLDDQGPLVGEPLRGANDWFFDGSSAPPTLLGEGNIDGYLGRADGVPVYIGRILDPAAMGGDLTAADFQAAGRLENLQFKAMDTTPVTDFNNPENIKIGTVSFRDPAALAQGDTDLAAGATKTWRETGAIGVVGTNLDIDYVQNADGTGDVVVADLKATANAAGITDFGGQLMVNGKVLAVQNADLVDAGTRLLRVQAGDAGALAAGASTTVAIDATLTGSVEDDGSSPAPAVAAPGTYPTGRSGTLGSRMVVSLVSGDFVTTSADANPTPNGASDDQDIDAISAQLRDVAVGQRSLLFDVTRDGAVTAADRTAVITALVTRTGGNGTVGGDIDRDGHVNTIDYGLWAIGYGGPVTDATAIRGWADGDIDGDGESNTIDYGLWAIGYETGPVPPGAPVAAPEPATMALLAMGALALVKRRRRA